ncbi:MAG: thioredoxin [Bacteroidales bacterium]|jgi:thioredoxin 1
MRSTMQNITYFLLLLISVILISCTGRGYKNEKQAGDTTANNANTMSSAKDTIAKTENKNAGDTAVAEKQLITTKNKQQSNTNNANPNKQTPSKPSQVSTQVHAVVTALNSQTFNETIKSGVTLVDFWAVWCKPCRMEAPIVEEINTEMAGRAKVCKMDIDQNKDIANNFNIQYIPTLIIFKDGRIVKQFTGFTSKDDILGALTNQLK